MTAGAFFEPVGDGRFRATEHTSGPWDRGAQHGGPPSALLAREIEHCSPAWPGSVARLSFDILGPVPVGEVVVRSRVLRPGRSVDLVEAEMEAGGRTVLRAQGWRVREQELALPAHAAIPAPALPSEEPEDWWGWPCGFLEAVEWRSATARNAPGPATVWGRQRYPLVAGEEPSGLQRLTVIADCGNGASFVLPIESWFFINPELTVHLNAVPTGEWICLDAETRIDERGFGLASSRLYDLGGLVGRGAQSLYVGPR